jgi:hypothetical protein
VGRAPTGGDKGAGTINATVYDDNVLLTDPVFENYYGAAVTDPTWARGSRPLFTLADVASVTALSTGYRGYQRARTSKRSGSSVAWSTWLWQGQEQQQIYILRARIAHRRLEQAVGDASTSAQQRRSSYSIPLHQSAHAAVRHHERSNIGEDRPQDDRPASRRIGWRQLKRDRPGGATNARTIAHPFTGWNPATRADAHS